MAMSIIGGAQRLSGLNTKKAKSACSSMHFDDDYEVNWLPVFFIKELEDIVIRIDDLL